MDHQQSATLAGQSGQSDVLTYDDGIQIIDITNPSSPTPVLAITDGADGYAELGGAASITTTTILQWGQLDHVYGL